MGEQKVAKLEAELSECKQRCDDESSKLNAEVSSHMEAKAIIESECVDLKETTRGLSRKIGASEALLKERDSEIQQLKLNVVNERSARATDSA
eukprot:4086158-Ditylum_brightwellii.AAC.1